MKYLLHTIAFLALALASCANLPASVQQNSPAVPPESMQERTSTETVSENPIEVVGGDEQALREFIRQWAIPNYSDGSVPDDIPYDLPVPQDSRTTGGITGTWVDYLLIFDSNLTAESIQGFYARSLVDRGWKEAPNMQGGGFTGQSYPYQLYCSGENEAVLSVETPSAPEEKSSIRLTLDLTPDHQMCNADPNYGSTYISAIPELRAPKGITVQGTGAGSSDRDANMTANLKGTLSAAEVADFYNEQLHAAGWELQNADQGKGANWSNWIFQDEQGTDWFGALMVMEALAQGNTLFAYVSIEKIQRQ